LDVFLTYYSIVKSESQQKNIYLDGICKINDADEFVGMQKELLKALCSKGFRVAAVDLRMKKR